MRTLIHEAAHLAGIGQPSGESYCVDFDCDSSCGDANSADSWAHFIHCLGGGTADVPMTIQGPAPRNRRHTVSSFPGSPQLLKAGVVQIDPETSRIVSVVTLQYNPDTVTRSLQPQRIEASGNRSEVLRLTGPPVETFRFTAEIDAADKLEFPDSNPDAVDSGIQPQLAALETLVYPTSAECRPTTNRRRREHSRSRRWKRRSRCSSGA